jgi:hypothetical protein
LFSGLDLDHPFVLLCVARVIGVHHQAQLLVEMGSQELFARVDLEHDPPESLPPK